ncbi:MAG: hypothetical protein KGI06_01335 [Candidatus Micrarchaeota archaeon]|nr:hypothetical protein [Candidatus Micrarchaeota archaeon]
MKFSNRYSKFERWLSVSDKRTNYTQRITRLHSLYPKASLEQLRGHAQFKAKPVPVYKRSWNSLTAKERLIRERALEVLTDARKTGKSVYKLSREHRIGHLAVRKATNAFRKVKGRWKPSKFDRISRIMAINENGKEVFIELNDSRQASIIGAYQSAIREYLNTGNPDALKAFKGKKVRDAKGKLHTLDTDPESIRAIAESRENPEFYDIYKIDV